MPVYMNGNKGLTQKEFDWMKRLEKEVDKHWDELNEWEKKFVEDLLERFRMYGMRTQISKKQWETITEISDKAII